MAGVLAVAGVGCRSVVHKDAANGPMASTNQGESPGDRSDFRSTVGHEQEVSVHLDLARAFEAQGNDEAAVSEYQKAIEVANGPSRRGSGRITKAQKALAHRRMGNALDRLGRFAQSETHYREALKETPDDARIWNDSGYSYYLQSRWADAERSYLTAARQAPNDSKIQTNLGLCQAAAGKTDEALASLTRAGGPIVAHANLGYILAATGRPEEARQHYQAALGLQPDFGPARYALAKLDDERPGSSIPMSGTAVASRAPSAPSTVVGSERLVLSGVGLATPTTPTGIPNPLPIVAPQPVAVAAAMAPVSTSGVKRTSRPIPAGSVTRNANDSSLSRASAETGIPLPPASIPPLRGPGF